MGDPRCFPLSESLAEQLLPGDRPTPSLEGKTRPLAGAFTPP